MQPSSRLWRITTTIQWHSFAVLSVAIALGASLALQWWTHYRILFPFFAAIIASGWIGGRGPAGFAVVLSLLAGDYFFGTPLYNWRISGIDQAYFIPFAVATVIAGWCGSLRKRAQDWSAQSRNTTDRRDAKA